MHQSDYLTGTTDHFLDIHIKRHRRQLDTLSEGSVLSFPIAVLAGVVASGICPCTFPVGLGIAGLSSSNHHGTATVQKSLPIAFSFFLGIVITLTVLGAVAGHIEVLLFEFFGKYWALAMAVISLVAAVMRFMGLI